MMEKFKSDTEGIPSKKDIDKNNYNNQFTFT